MGESALISWLLSRCQAQWMLSPLMTLSLNAHKTPGHCCNGIYRGRDDDWRKARDLAKVEYLIHERHVGTTCVCVFPWCEIICCLVLCTPANRAFTSLHSEASSCTECILPSCCVLEKGPHGELGPSQVCSRWGSSSVSLFPCGRKGSGQSLLVCFLGAKCIQTSVLTWAMQDVTQLFQWS